MRTILLAALIGSFLLAPGCVGTDDARPAAEQEPADETQAAPPEEIPAPAPPGVAPNETGPAHVNITGSVDLQPAVGLFCPKEEIVGPCQAGRLTGHPVEVPRGGPIRATLTATWAHATPAAEKLRFYWRVEGGEELTTSGESPFTMDIPPEWIPNAGEYGIAVRPDSPGATVDEKVDFVLTLQYG